MLPYLKSLHFLSVKFRIEFKIALLTHKCLHGYAPTYLKNLINFRSVSARYSLHVNDDNWLLQTVISLIFARSQSMFSYASSKVWSLLPLSLREIETSHSFKKRFKAYYSKIRLYRLRLFRQFVYIENPFYPQSMLFVYNDSCSFSFHCRT